MHTQAAEEWMDSGEHDAAEELAFRRRFFPGSQSLRRNRQLLDIQASPKYRKLLDIQGSLDFFGLEAGSARSGGVAGSKGGVGGARGCERYRERWWVESERGWPPALVDRLEAFLARKAP